MRRLVSEIVCLFSRKREVTGETAEVSTQLKATMQGFLSPSTNMTKSLEKLGYATGKDLLESKGLQGALELLKESVGTFPNDEASSGNDV